MSPRKLKGEGRDLINYVSLRFFYVAEDVGGTDSDVIWVASKKLFAGVHITSEVVELFLFRYVL